MAAIMKDTYGETGDFVYWASSAKTTRRALAFRHEEGGYHLHLQTLLPERGGDGERWETAPDLVSAATVEDADEKAESWVAAGIEGEEPTV